MKKIVFLSLFLSTAIIFISCDDDNETLIALPVTIESYIANNYPDYSIDEAEEESLCEGGQGYEVELEDSNDNEVELTFDAEGSFLYTETEIETSALPALVAESITTNYADYSIDEAERLDMHDDTTRYEVEIKNGNSSLSVILESDGTVVCEEEDDE